MRKLVMAFAGSAAALGALACDNPLEVKNQNNPDVERAFGSPASVEQLIGTTFQLIFSANLGSSTALNPALMAMSFENASPLGNFGMGVRSALPRVSIQNTPGNQTATENFRDFSGLTRAARLAVNGILAIDKFRPTGGLGSTGATSRADAFAHFTTGVANLHLAMTYDSAAIITPATIKALPDEEAVPPLSGYREVAAAGMQMLDSAIIIATAAGSTMPSLPDTWINGNALTQANFLRFMRSMRARLAISWARDAADRAAINWTNVLADATNGITADFNITLNTSTGWDMAWIGTQYQFGAWHQMSPVIIGMADTTGAYAAWMATAPNNRTPFLIRTPDRRFPAGDTRAAQQTTSNAANRGKSGSAPTAPLYFINRSTGDDISGDPSGTSYYDHYRFAAIALASRNGPWPFLTKAENDMIAAEAHLRKATPDVAAAVALIDPWRMRAGLPKLAGIVTSITTPVPGARIVTSSGTAAADSTAGATIVRDGTGAYLYSVFPDAGNTTSCVPRAPIGASNGVTNTPVCGTVFEAMKWEKRMESAYTGWSQWFFDSRRWNDLPEGTPLQYALPYHEANARGIPFRLQIGGVGGPDAAPKGTYGF